MNEKNTTNVAAIFDELIALRRKVVDLVTIESLLGWDQQVKMPPKGSGQRSRQLALIAEIVHRAGTNPRIGELLDQLTE